MNGTSTSSDNDLVLFRENNFSFVEGDEYKYTVEYISGTATGTGNSTISAEAETSMRYTVSPRYYVDPEFGKTYNASIL